jgi:hypothetical protein
MKLVYRGGCVLEFSLITYWPAFVPRGSQEQPGPGKSGLPEVTTGDVLSPTLIESLMKTTTLHEPNLFDATAAFCAACRLNSWQQKPDQSIDDCDEYE